MIASALRVFCDKCKVQMPGCYATKAELLDAARQMAWRVDERCADDWCPDCMKRAREALPWASAKG